MNKGKTQRFHNRISQNNMALLGYIVFAARHSKSNDSMPLLIIFAIIIVIGGIYLYITSWLDSYKIKQHDLAKKLAFEFFLKEEKNNTRPKDLVDYTKQLIKIKYKFIPDTEIRGYKRCYYMKTPKDFTWIENSPTECHKLNCSVDACEHNKKPRCELHKKFDFDYLRRKFY